MNPKIVYLVDENEEQRRAFTRTLNELFADTGVVIQAMVPLPAAADYAPLLAEGTVAALILDQKLEDGGVSYSGTELSAHLRGIVPKLPIVILSNYTDDPALFEKGEGEVEYIVSKTVIADPTCRNAQIFKARFLRRLDVFADVLDERAQRYHDLLVKSVNEPLSAEELAEMKALEGERVSAVAAAERERQEQLDADIERLKSLLGRDKLV
jgi:CheY-like chemotaxis protein